MLYLEKHNRGDAAREFKAALEINPNAAEAHVGLASAWLEERQIEKTEAALARALEINPRLLDAWLLKADLLWDNFQVHETLALLQEKAVPLNPICEETLGRVAACYLLLDRTSERFARLVERVTRRNPHAGEFYFAPGRSAPRAQQAGGGREVLPRGDSGHAAADSARRPISACST